MTPRHSVVKLTSLLDVAFLLSLLTLTYYILHILVAEDVYKSVRRTVTSSSLISNAGTTLQERQQSITGMSPRNTNMTTMSSRLDHIKQMCSSTSNWNSGMQGVAYILNQSPVELAYCEVPKIGCTFWKRIFRFLNKDCGKQNITSPNDIPRFYTHVAPFKTTNRISLKDPDKYQFFLQLKNKFMFTRDPYSRLWSAYLDKFFLPDFWNSFGRSAINNTPRKFPSKCGDDVTFAEFIRYIIGWMRLQSNTAVKSMPVDPHFLPVSKVCNPCSINFTFIGRQETFVTDSRYILKETGIQPLIRDDLFSNRVENEIKSLSEYYLDLAERRSKSDPDCYNKTEICRRLWKVFQINGFIGNEIAFPEWKFKHLIDAKDIKIMFISTALQVYVNGSNLHSVWMKQRRHNLISAYKSLPENLLQAFQEMYAGDFELFGYRRRPEDIYSKRPR